jgi:hypothetical protein
MICYHSCCLENQLTTLSSGRHQCASFFGHCDAAQRAEDAVSHPHQGRKDITPEAGLEKVKS